MPLRTRFSLLTLSLLILASACGTRAPSPAPEPAEPPSEWQIDSRPEHRVAAEHLVSLVNQIEGVGRSTAIILEGEALIGVLPDPKEEKPRNRSLEEEVARRAVEMSPFVTQAWVTSDPDLFDRIAEARRRIHADESGDALRREVHALWTLMQSVGTSAF